MSVWPKLLHTCHAWLTVIQLGRFSIVNGSSLVCTLHKVWSNHFICWHTANTIHGLALSSYWYTLLATSRQFSLDPETPLRRINSRKMVLSQWLLNYGLQTYPCTCIWAKCTTELANNSLPSHIHACTHTRTHAHTHTPSINTALIRTLHMQLSWHILTVQLPPFWQGWVVHWSLNWQLTPENPSGHAHPYPFGAALLTWHTASFAQQLRSAIHGSAGTAK